MFLTLPINNLYILVRTVYTYSGVFYKIVFTYTLQMEQTFEKSSCSLLVNKQFDGSLHMTRGGTVNKKSEAKWNMDRKV